MHINFRVRSRNWLIGGAEKPGLVVSSTKPLKAITTLDCYTDKTPVHERGAGWQIQKRDSGRCIGVLKLPLRPGFLVFPSSRAFAFRATLVSDVQRVASPLHGVARYVSFIPYVYVSFTTKVNTATSASRTRYHTFNLHCTSQTADVCTPPSLIWWPPARSCFMTTF